MCEYLDIFLYTNVKIEKLEQIARSFSNKFSIQEETSLFPLILLTLWNNLRERGSARKNIVKYLFRNMLQLFTF